MRGCHEMNACHSRTGKILYFFLCSTALLLFSDRALCAVPYREIHGSWVIDLAAANKESLTIYFGVSDERDGMAKAASLVLSFDTRKMKFERALSGKKETWNIARIEEGQDKTRILWFQGIKFPDHIKALPDGRMQYGSDWGKPWMFMLQRKPEARNE